MAVGGWVKEQGWEAQSEGEDQVLCWESKMS